MNKHTAETPVDEPLKPIQWDAIRATPQTEGELVPQSERPFVNPQTAKDWGDLAKTLKTASPDQYPAIKPDELNAFKKAVAYATGGMPYFKWVLIGVLPAAFFMLTDNLLKVARWGAIFWFFGAACCILVPAVLGGQATRDAQQKAVLLGQRLKLLKN